jgi:4-hydroxybenzoate polyprenyltransferase
VALFPKGAFSSKHAAIFVVAVSAVGLAVVPVLTVPAMLLAGFKWRSAPRWTRLTLVIGGVIFAAYFIALKPATPPRHG